MAPRSKLIRRKERSASRRRPVDPRGERGCALACDRHARGALLRSDELSAGVSQRGDLPGQTRARQQNGRLPDPTVRDADGRDAVGALQVLHPGRLHVEDGELVGHARSIYPLFSLRTSKIPAMDLDLETYAAVMAELVAAGDGRAAVLARRGLDEERWEAVDAAWQARIEEAMAEEGEGVPALLAAYAAAYGAAQRVLAPPISLEQFARITRFLQATGDIQAALAKVGATLADYVRSNEHWSRRMAEDPAEERRFQEALRGDG